MSRIHDIARVIIMKRAIKYISDLPLWTPLYYQTYVSYGILQTMKNTYQTMICDMLKGNNLTYPITNSNLLCCYENIADKLIKYCWFDIPIEYTTNTKNEIIMKYGDEKINFGITNKNGICNDIGNMPNILIGGDRSFGNFDRMVYDHIMKRILFIMFCLNDSICQDVSHNIVRLICDIV